MRHGFRWIGLLLAIAGPPSPALALDLSLLTRVYEETYVGETAYPLTPELDLAGMGGMAGGSLPAFADAPVLTGTVARVTMAGGDPQTEEFTAPLQVGGLAYSSFALRGDFANASGGGSASSLVATFQLSTLGATVTAGGSVGTLEVWETISTMPFASVSLPGAMASAIDGGAAHTVDLLVDRASRTLTASVDVTGFATVTVGPAAYADPPAGEALVVVIQSGAILGTLDFTRFRAYEAGPGVVAWGNDSRDATLPPPSVNGVAGSASAVAGGYHSCAIQAGTGIVVCWGDDAWGETVVPNEVNGVGGTASALTASNNHSCAIQAGTGNVVCWGFEALGGHVPPPRSVNGVSGTASAVDSGSNHDCAIQAGTGAVVCWGDDSRGQASPPSSVDGVSGTASAISAGSAHSCAIQAGTGIAVCWGDDAFGQASPPNEVNGVSGTASAIDAGGSLHSCAIQAGTGDVACWGFDLFGQVSPPDSVNGVDGTASAIALGDFHSCAIQAGTGNVVCWGQDDQGRATPPAAVNGIAGTATELGAGNDHTLAVMAPPPAGLVVNVTYSTESIVTGPLSLGLSSLPSELHATITLPGVQARENVVAGLADVGSFALVLGDALATQLTNFSLVTDGAGEVTTLSYATQAIDTGTATSTSVANGSFSATIQGTDTASGLAFEYQYASSAQALELSAAPPLQLPALSSWAPLAAALLLAGASLASRSRRAGSATLSQRPGGASAPCPRRSGAAASRTASGWGS